MKTQQTMMRVLNELERPPTLHTVPFIPQVRMRDFMRYILAPMLHIKCEDSTAFAKVSTPDLRVVFNHDCGLQPMSAMLTEHDELVVRPWPARDPSTQRSLIGNAGPLAAILI